MENLSLKVPGHLYFDPSLYLFAQFTGSMTPAVSAGTEEEPKALPHTQLPMHPSIPKA
jgi:hypothetical protein